MERTVKYYQTIQAGLAAVGTKSKPQRQVHRSPALKGGSLLVALAYCIGSVGVSTRAGLLSDLEHGD